MQNPQTLAHSNVEVADRLDWFRRSDRPSDKVFDGTVTAVKFREGFGLHTLNARAKRDFSIRTERAPSVVLHCFLEGATSAWLADTPMNLGRVAGAPVRFVLTSTKETLSFARRSDPDEYVRKVSIQMSHDWLAESGLVLPDHWDSTQNFHQRIEWDASARDVATMEQLVSNQSFTDPMSRMMAEAMTLELVAGSFRKMHDASTSQALTLRETHQLRRVEDLANQTGPIPDLHTIAREAGLSASSLRRLVHKAHGCSPLAYLRALRLEQARQALETANATVSEAASIAGFSSPENFSTAFRRAFGMSPSALRM